MGSYMNTFIRVSLDCPVEHGVVPMAKKESKPAHLIQYELLINEPYAYTQDELIYAVHIRHKQIPQSEVETRGDEIYAALFAKNHPCLRVSMLPKKYGWGVHYDEAGRIAIYPMESETYQSFIDAEQAVNGPKVLYAMRNARG